VGWPFTAPSPPLHLVDLTPLGRLHHAVAAICDIMTGSLFDPILSFFVFFAFRIVLRRQWLAAGAFVALLVFMNSYDSSYPRMDVPLWVIVGSTAAFVLWHYGILTLMPVKAFSQLLSDWPRTLDFSQWYAGIGMLPLLLTVVAAIYAFRISLGGRVFPKPAPVSGLQ
jgi:hypothetical protein